jgi:MerR family transcriptional regulator, light-induced transcriptional regulator
MTFPSTPAQPDLPRHPVRVVAQRTGLSSHVLRAWERRYAVVSPTRTEGGQRLYSDSDIARLLLLRTLTAAGGAISRLAQLPHGELSRLVREEPLSVPETAPGGSAGQWRAGALAAIGALDSSALRRELGRAALALGVPPFLEQVVSPVLREVGTRWHDGRLGIAHEHLTSAVVREVLSWVRESSETTGAAPTLVVATPTNQMHEGGALLVAATAAAEGWRVTYLGVNLPGLEIAAAALKTGARAVALSLIHPDDDPTLGNQLEVLRRSLPAGVTLLVGGSAAPAYRVAVEAAQGEVATELTALRDALRRLAGQA